MKHTALNFFASLILIAFTSTASYAQYSSKQVDSIMDYAMQKFNVAGVGIAIVKDGKVVHSKGYGVKSSISKNPVDAQTNFAIASNSKAFTTAALAMLVEEGKITWDDKVKTHIPEFKMYNPYVTENFNIQDLLTHRSGLGLGIGDLMIFPDGSNFTMTDVLGGFEHFKPVSAFRTKYDYDNLLYLIAGEVIARVSGISFEDFITQRIFEPLQMKHTYADIDRIHDDSNLAVPHSSDNIELKPLPQFEKMVNAAAAGIYSNVDDISKWMLLHLNKGAYGPQLKDTLFTVANQREMWKLHTPQNVNRNPRYNSHFAGYGLGWALSDMNGNLVVEHTGGFPGMLSKTVLVPDLNLGIVILTNTSDDGAGIFASVSQTLLDNYLGLDDIGWIDTYSERFKTRKQTGDAVTEAVWKAVKKAKSPKALEENIIGMYKDNWFGKVEIFRKGNQLWIQSLRSPKLNGAIHYYQANTFAIQWEYDDLNADAFAMFNLDENGKAISIKMKGISPNIDFSYDFHDLDLVRINDKK